MAEISAAMVKALRERTGAGILDCKKALAEHDGNMEEAADYLRKKSLAQADKKASRIAAEGMVTSYIHGGGRIGVLVEINCETDFVARNEDFQAFAKDICMQIAADRPRYVSRDEVPADVIEHEREILMAQARETGKPEAVLERIVEGRIQKFFTEICLLEQTFIKNPDVKVEEVLKNLIARIGENIRIRRFVRYELGEGLEKRQDNFAEEVAAQAGLS